MRHTLDFLKQLAHGLAIQFGSSCEIAIHDLKTKDLEKSIVYIENGHISNRQIGDGPSGIVLETLQSDPSTIHDKLSYLTKTEDGRILKSSTFYIRDDDGSISYIFSLNYDITAFTAASTAIQSLIATKDKLPDLTGDSPRQITHNVNELLDLLIEQAVAKVGKPVAMMNKDDKVAVVSIWIMPVLSLLQSPAIKFLRIWGYRNSHFTVTWANDTY